LSTKNFIVNPFTGRAGDRLYRTGELGRYLPDGAVEWVGRKERRAGIRGFRVELAEVEAALQRYPGVGGAALIAQEGTAPEDARLSAYMACAKGSGIDAEKLRAFLSSRLPHYMVPSQIHFLERLPLNPNGKINYATLATLPAAEPTADRPDEEPIGELEATVKKILAEVLRRERVSRNDHFFELGGHSLLAAQATARIREKLGVELDLRTFLEAPTVAAICRRIERARPEEREEIEL